jgi:type IV pilus assembly protein PilB
MQKKFLGERLLESGLVRERQLAEALHAQHTTGEQLGQILVRLGHVTEEDLMRLLCEDAGVPFVRLEGIEPDPEALSAVPEPFARSIPLLPLSLDDGLLTAALADPFDVNALLSLERVAGRKVTAVGAPRTLIESFIDHAYRRLPRTGVRPQAGASPAAGAGSPPRPPAAPAAPAPAAAARVEEGDAGATAAEVVDEIFRQAVHLGATDIHLEPTPQGVRVRYRLDGILRDGPLHPRSYQSPMITRIKVLAGLNIAESRMPQDGRLRARALDREVDLRVSTFPTIHGEDLVLRVLDRSRVSLRLESLGLAPADLDVAREILARPWGLVLITGPTGSGKTTTLYSALSEMNNGERCILTLEDPVEYEIEGIRQAQVNARAGLTFATGLRSMLRHDPDVILVGEIRDLETAQIALNAAMTGHVVLSTIHTNTAAGAIPRLLEMGTEPFALASSLQLAVAQRLVRLLCPECRQPTEVPIAVRRRFALGESNVYRGTGCPSCRQTGYRGRAAIFELLPVNETISAAIHAGGSAEAIQGLANRPTLLEAGLARVRSGETSLEELLRVVSI